MSPGKAEGRPKRTLSERFSNALGLAKQVQRPPPTRPDGLYDSEAVAPTAPPLVGSTSLLHDVVHQVKAGRVLGDVHALGQLVTSLQGPIDDRDLLLENLIEMLASMETGSSSQRELSSLFLTKLYHDLPHPPTTLIGHGFRFRTIDGSNTNVWLPDVGRAGLPYARTVTPERTLPHWLPDAGVVFDALLKRTEFKPHPSGISSLLFAFATLIVHTLFRTSRTDPSINETSSYLDLSVLYGHNQAFAEKVRTFKDGKLHPDVWAEPRLVNLPPQVAALLVVFNRNHNFIAETLFRINEKGTFRPWGALGPDDLVKQDDEIFQTARLVNCGAFVNVVLHDYLRAILGLGSTGSTFCLDPRVPIGDLPRGTGNHSSVEFGIIYSWHQCLGQEDERWTVERFRTVFGDRDPSTITVPEFTKAATEMERQQDLEDPRRWTFGGLRRGEDGRFDDEELANVILDATEQVAGSFGAGMTPAVLKVIETMRIKSSRDVWGVCSLNEFRRFLGLQPFASFRDHNSDPGVAANMERIYVHPDNIELYTGLMAEEAKPARVGSGLCPGYTISRAILSDAVALTRGDRFFTTSFDRGALTAWGFNDCASDPNGGSYGGVLGKLLMRALPGAFRLDSAHALFPFQTLAKTRDDLEKVGVAEKYDFERPAYVRGWQGVETREAVGQVLSTPETFGVVYSSAIRSISSEGYGFMLGFDDRARHDLDRKLMDSTVFPAGYVASYSAFFAETMARPIAERSWSVDGGRVKTVDFVRDCSTMASVYWVARTFGIPLKVASEGLERGTVTPQELYLMLTGLFTYVFILPLGDMSNGWQLRETSLRSAKLLRAIVEARLRGVDRIPEDLMPGPSGSLTDPGPHAVAFYEAMLASKRPIHELVSNCMGVMVASTSNQGELAAHTLNLYLEPEHRDSYEDLVKLAQAPATSETDAKLRAYVWEAMRLDPQTPAVPRIVKKATTIVDGDRRVDLKEGDHVLASLTDANMDPTLFPEPEKVKIDRDPALYRVFGFGMHTCLGAKIVDVAQPAILRAAFRLKHLRRAPGNAGRLYRASQELAGLKVWTYIDANNDVWPFPVSMSVEFDGE